MSDTLSAKSSPEGSPSPLMTLAITCPLHRAIEKSEGKGRGDPGEEPRAMHA